MKYLRRKDDGHVIAWNPSAALNTEVFEAFEADVGEQVQPAAFLAPEDQGAKKPATKPKSADKAGA